MEKKESEILIDVRAGKKFPLKLDGNIIEDNIFDLYPDLLIFKDIRDLIKVYGKAMANSILWAHIVLLDPRRMLFDKLTFVQREKIISEEYFPVEWSEFLHIKKFVLDILLANKDIVSYVVMKELHEKNRRVEKDFKKTRANENILIGFENLALGVITKADKILAGDEQYGGKLWLVNNM